MMTRLIDYITAAEQQRLCVGAERSMYLTAKECQQQRFNISLMNERDLQRIAEEVHVVRQDDNSCYHVGIGKVFKIEVKKGGIRAHYRMVRVKEE